MPRHLFVPALLSLVASCGQTPSPTPARPVVVAVASAPSAVAPVASEAPPQAMAKPPAPPPQAQQYKVALTLKPGRPPCTLVMDGKLFADHPEWFSITSVTRMATEESGGCAAGTIYDLAKETKSDPDEMDPWPLEAGTFVKPGQTLPPDVADGHLWNVIDDLDFDDVADLCVVIMTGAYNYSQKCWLFDTKSGTFVRHAELDDLIFMNVDRKKKKLTNGFRAGGPIYENNEYEWRQGKLVHIYQATSYFGEKPDGTALPKGSTFWLIRRELRGGKLVKTFEGPLRDKP